MYVIFHFHTYFTKFGIGRATYDSAQEVRSGDLTRDEAVGLVQKFDGEFPARWSEEIFKYLSLPLSSYPNLGKYFQNLEVSNTYYHILLERFRSPHLWIYDENNGWRLRAQVKTIPSAILDTTTSWVGNRF